MLAISWLRWLFIFKTPKRKVCAMFLEPFQKRSEQTGRAAVRRGLQWAHAKMADYVRFGPVRLVRARCTTASVGPGIRTATT